MSTLEQEITRRRTFAIISHPDAGKTTLTEKFLLYGGAIQSAGMVKGKQHMKHAVSDWMEIEKQRGISVTSSVMQFEFDGYKINILDTPGHQDFSEDTYRTLVAADSAVMIIDAAKGVEPQTIKLFRVCKMRGIPIFTFVNKLDRAGKNPFDLMEEIENVLGIRSTPINWPIGTDGDFQGVYDRLDKQIELYAGDESHGARKLSVIKGAVDSPEIAAVLAPHYIERLKEETELLDAAGDPFDLDKIRAGELTPMFFGSAMNNFGVESFLKKYLRFTLPPTPRVSSEGPIPACSDVFSGSIFKIQANMNPAHHDRVAFMRICSGRFEKGMTVTLTNTGKLLKLSQPQQFMAQERELIEEAYAGDMVGLFDPGVFHLGDTLASPGSRFTFDRIPVFAPEHFARVYAPDSGKRKQFSKGVSQLAEEGAIQIFREPDAAREEFIVGVVGVLQFEVLEYRLANEYNTGITLDRLPYRFVRWVAEDTDVTRLKLSSSTHIALDETGSPVILFENEWSIRWATENNPGLTLSDVMLGRIKA